MHESIFMLAAGWIWTAEFQNVIDDNIMSTATAINMRNSKGGIIEQALHQQAFSESVAGREKGIFVGKWFIMGMIMWWWLQVIKC